MQLKIQVMIYQDPNQKKAGNPDKGDFLEEISDNWHWSDFLPVTVFVQVWFGMETGILLNV